MAFNVILTLLLLRVSFLRKKDEPFLLENTSNLTHEFLYDNFCKEFNVNEEITRVNCFHFNSSDSPKTLVIIFYRTMIFVFGHM